MSAENLNHFTAEYNTLFKRCEFMRIKYFGKNKENEKGRYALISFTDNECDLYDFIANYENTYGDETRKFNGRVFVDERDENGVTINEAYIDVKDFDDFNDFKTNYKDAKKKFKSLKKQTAESELKTETERESEVTKSINNSLYGITANSSDIYNEYNETKKLLADVHFERLTRTLYKSLFKAIGLTETRKIHFIISNNMVFFNYNGIQYKYYPSQCKVFKKCGRKYQRINWKNFADDNSPTDQKQALGRSPPFTPDIRSSTINDLK